MLKNYSDFKLKDRNFNQKLLQWASRFKYCCLLDSNNYPSIKNKKYDILIGVSNTSKWSYNGNDSFSHLIKFSKNKWVFGHLSYDLKNETEPSLYSNNTDRIGFSNIHFFEPNILIQIKGVDIRISGTQPDKVYNDVLNESLIKESSQHNIIIKNKLSKATYIKKINALLEHLKKGDIYEVNFCQEFYSENTAIDPVACFNNLNNKQKSPFSAYYKISDKHVLCSSPERFIKKDGHKVISQPIKGTIKRGLDKSDDLKLINELKTSIKEKSENSMVVDLVRNDLCKTCITGSVKVSELMKVNTFNEVHQLISTIEGTLENTNGINTIKEAFPMGSMTGMPKYKAMQLIEKYEDTKRGLFSGTIGYIDPNNDFDFNVIIRSILYNEMNQQLSIHTGGAITYLSSAENEYEESLLKARAMIKVLQ